MPLTLEKIGELETFATTHFGGDENEATKIIT